MVWGYGIFLLCTWSGLYNQPIVNILFFSTFPIVSLLKNVWFCSVKPNFTEIKKCLHDEFFMNWNFISRIVHLNEWFRVETSFLCRITGSYEFLVVNDHLLLYRFSGKKCNNCATYFLSNNLSFWHVERMKKKFNLPSLCEYTTPLLLVSF